jgi:hypothetical protein
MREGGKNNPIALVSILILSPNKLTGSRTMIEGSRSRFYGTQPLSSNQILSVTWVIMR